MLYLTGVIILIILIYLMPVKMIMKTIRKDENDVLVIRLIVLYGLLKLKYEIPYIDFILRRGKAGLLFKSELKQPDEKKVFAKSKSMMTTEQFKKMYDIYRQNKSTVKKALDYIVPKTKVYDLAIILKIGTGDAAMTALSYGMAWIVIGSILSLLNNTVRLTIENIIVSPVFDNETFNIEMGCIITVKLGHIINTGIKLLPVVFFMRRHKISVKELTTSA